MCIRDSSGAPGFGVKTSAKFFDQYGYSWNSIVKAFKSKNLTELDALRNARLAKILTAEDYDFKSDRPILWTPTNAETRADYGAAIQDEENGNSSGESPEGRTYSFIS